MLNAKYKWPSISHFGAMDTCRLPAAGNDSCTSQFYRSCECNHWDCGQRGPTKVHPRLYLRTYFFTSMVNSAPYMLPPASAVMPSGPVESAAAG